MANETNILINGMNSPPKYFNPLILDRQTYMNTTYYLLALTPLKLGGLSTPIFNCNLKQKLKHFFGGLYFFLGSIFLGRVVVIFPKIVINLPRIYVKLPCKGEPCRFRQTHRQRFCYFYMIISTVSGFDQSAYSSI